MAPKKDPIKKEEEVQVETPVVETPAPDAVVPDPELDPVKLKEESDRIAALMAAKKPEEPSFTKADVARMIADALAGQHADESLDDKPREYTVRVPRFMGKFVIGFKNMNVDPYFPDLVVQAFDVWDEKTRTNIAHVTLVFEDKTELVVPLETALKRSVSSPLPLVKTIEKDTSYSQGKVERKEFDGKYGMNGTGLMMNAKVKQSRYMCLVKFPDGKDVEVGPEVINWN